jgi:SagB-type dehydrogenase family enzyme
VRFAELGREIAAAQRVRPIADTSSSTWPAGWSDLLPKGVDPSQHLPGDVAVTDLGAGNTLRDVLIQRRSERVFGAPSLMELGTLLCRVGLSRYAGTDEEGHELGRRPCPSAGARYPLSLLLAARDVCGLRTGGFVLDPERALLRSTKHELKQLDRALLKVADALRSDEPPPAVIFIVAHPLRTLSRYPEGLSLLWREAGVVLGTLHLVATELGLASCIVGTTATLEDPSDRPSAPVDIGALAVGAAPNNHGGGE